MIVDKSELKILGWNIHGSASMGWNNEYEIKEFVVDRIMSEEAHIVILNEFVFTRGWDYFQSKLIENNYVWFMTQTTSQNGILIAVNKKIDGLDLKEIEKYESGKISAIMNTNVAEKPNFLQVELKINEQSIFIIGTRIRDAANHISQFNALKEHLDSIHADNKIICNGDFNEWKNHMCDKLGKDYIVCTPRYQMGEWQNYDTLDKWSAIVKNKQTGKESKSLIDHIVVKNVKVSNEDYQWDFVTTINGYGDLKPEDYKSNLVGLPDHAILTANIKI